MSRAGSLRLPAALLGVALAGTFALPVFAATPTPVTYQPGNHWAQEVDGLNRDNSNREYSVSVPADQTLQINLITRDPNIFFKVRDDTNRDNLVDTMKTGATTWSTKTKGATNYTIRVYADPQVLDRQTLSKYALQVGQYGAADMRPASTPVTFAANQPWAQETGAVDAQAPAHDYTAVIQGGRTLQVNLVSNDANLHFRVLDPAGQELVDTAKTSAKTWSTTVAAPTNYTVRVYAAEGALPPGTKAVYTVQLGQFANGAETSAPAPAGTAATPPAASGAR